MIDAKTILSAKWPEELFPGDLAAAKSLYRELAKAWHPDHNNDPCASAVFAKLTELFEDAETRITQGFWQKGFGVELCGKKIGYLRKHKTEDGEVYVGNHHLTYVFAQPAMSFDSFRFASPSMQDEMAKTLPQESRWWGTERKVLHIRKSPDQLFLRDVVDHMNGLPAEHVAWIISRLCGFLCYLDWAKLTHNAINLDNLVIAPPFHSVGVLGGWQYSCSLGRDLHALPHSSYQLLPTKKRPEASRMLDAELVRQLGQTLLRGKSCPQAMEDWINSIPEKQAFLDLVAWRKALEKSFPRRFVEMKLSATDLYGGFHGRR